MNGNNQNDELWRAGLRRKLTSDEAVRWHDRLSGNPESVEEWERELELNRVLRELPDAPVASNFTSRVMAEVRREQAAEAARVSVSRPNWLRWPGIRRLAFAAVLGALATLSYQQYQVSARRHLAQSVAAFSQVALPTLEVARDFQAIEGLQQVSVVSASANEPDLLDALQP
jgi:hypothetical protein